MLLHVLAVERPFKRSQLAELGERTFKRSRILFLHSLQFLKSLDIKMQHANSLLFKPGALKSFLPLSCLPPASQPGEVLVASVIL